MVKTLGTLKDEVVTEAIASNDNGFIIFGRLEDDLFVTKIDQDGNQLWSKVHTGLGMAYGATQTIDGDFLIIGLKKSLTHINHSTYVAKLNSSGDTLWTSDYDISGDNWGNCIINTLSGGIIVTGGAQPSSSCVYKLRLISTDGTGDVIIDTIIKNECGISQSTHGIVATSDGFLTAGTASQKATLQMLLVKLNTTGNIVWQKEYGDGNISGTALTKTHDGGYTVAGSTGSYLVLWHFDENYNLQ